MIRTSHDCAPGCRLGSYGIGEPLAAGATHADDLHVGRMRTLTFGPASSHMDRRITRLLTLLLMFAALFATRRAGRLERGK